MALKFKSILLFSGTASLVVLTGLTLAIYFHRSNEELVCEGIDPKTNQTQRLTLSNRNGNTATARLYTGENSKLEIEDPLAVIQGDRDTVKVTAKGEKDLNFHFIKSCGTTPRCEIHRFKLPPAAQLKKEHENTVHAEREAYEYRKAASRQAEEFAKARELAIRAEAELNSARTQKGASPQRLKELGDNVHRLNEIAGKLADRLYAMSAATHDVNMQASQVRSLSSLNRIDIDAQELQVVHPEVWCRK